MSRVVPTPNLIAKARQDYLQAAASRTPGAISLSQAREQAARFADTHGIRIISLPLELASLVDTEAEANKINSAMMLSVYIRRLLTDPNDTYDQLIQEAANTEDKDGVTRSYSLTPDDFVPLAELACIQGTSCSVLANAAVQQAFRPNDLP